MKRALCMSLTTILSVCAIAIAAHSISSDRARAHDDESKGEWEYLVVQGGTTNLTPSDSGTMRKADGAFSRESFPLEKNLDKLGAKGWELVAVADSPRDPIYYLKRKK